MCYPPPPPAFTTHPSPPSLVTTPPLTLSHNVCDLGSTKPVFHSPFSKQVQLLSAPNSLATLLFVFSIHTGAINAHTHTHRQLDLWHFLLCFALLCFCFFFVSHKYFARSFCLVPIDRSICQRHLRRYKTWMQKVWNFAKCLHKAATDGASSTVLWFEC